MMRAKAEGGMAMTRRRGRNWLLIKFPASSPFDVDAQTTGLSQATDMVDWELTDPNLTNETTNARSLGRT